jgi:hypothetical protein
MSDDTLYSDGDVTVSRRVFRVGSTSYPIRGITAFAVNRKEIPPSRGWPLIVLLLTTVGACPTILVAQTEFPSNPTMQNVLVAFEVIAGAALTVWLWGKGKATTEWALTISTGGMQKQALITRDRKAFDAIVGALETAVSA